MESRKRSILEKKKIEFSICRKKTVVFFDKQKDAADYEGEDDEDIVVIDSGSEDKSFYINLGEIEIIPLITILNNPNDSIYSIKYKTISKDDISDIVGNKKIPSMLFEDPVRIWYGWKEGTILEITRNDGSKYYREVKKYKF